ncbi:MAG: hypothetical protein GY707_05180 [Desulfobacteraceae bacterium]|nr:hypothetical protein [Desulfobacteraceae bacterium]
MFKRDMVLCIREAGTSDTPVVLPVVDDTLDISTKAVSTSATRTTLGNPQFTDLTVNRGIQESTLKFTTYIKPYLDTNIVLPDSLLHESLFGEVTTNATQLCTNTTNSYNLKKFDIFMVYKDTNTTFSLKDAVTVSADYEFDIKGIARIKWQVKGVDFSQHTYLTYAYPTGGTHIPNKWTQVNITFPPLSTGYDLASTNFTLSIKNTIKFPYTEVTTERYTRPTNVPVIEKRDIVGKMSLYLKVGTLRMYNDLITSLEKTSYLNTAANFSAKIGPCGGTDYINITLDNVVLKYPKIKFDEISNLDLEFKGTSANICYKGD